MTSITRIITAFVLAFLFFPWPLAAAEKDATAPFGLSWSMTLPQAEKALGDIMDRRQQDRFTVLYALKSPKMLDGTDFMELLFDRDKGLVKITWIGQRVMSDTEGIEGRRRFQHLYDLLRGKYGAPVAESRAAGQKMYFGQDQFYECLAYKIGPCGVWAAGWRGDSYGAVSLALEGAGKGDGYLELTYESPVWQDLFDRNTGAARSKDRDAL